MDGHFVLEVDQNVSKQLLIPISKLYVAVMKLFDHLILPETLFSTNGTLVDGTKVRQGRQELNHGDEIHIVFKKSGTHCSKNLSF